MNCPVCKDSAMIVLELESIEVDYCPECCGLWLDGGELEILLDDADSAKKLLDSMKSSSIKEDFRKCPICRKKMHKIAVADDNNLVIDKCPSNHGLWFDKNELKDILTKANLDSDHKIQKLLTEMFSSK